MLAVSKSDHPVQTFSEIQREVEDALDVPPVDIKTLPQEQQDWYRST